jgi:hypothetical protein
MVCCRMAVEGTGMLRFSVHKMKTLDVKIETVTLGGKGK